MIGAQTGEGLLQLLHGDGFIAAVRAHLGHKHDFVPLAHKRATEPLFTFTAVIIPGAVEEIDTCVDGLRDDVVCVLEGFGGAEMIAAYANCRHLHSGFTKRAAWNLALAGLSRR